MERKKEIKHFRDLEVRKDEKIRRWVEARLQNFVGSHLLRFNTFAGPVVKPAYAVIL